MKKVKKTTKSIVNRATANRENSQYFLERVVIFSSGNLRNFEPKNCTPVLNPKIVAIKCKAVVVTFFEKKPDVLEKLKIYQVHICYIYPSSFFWNK